MIREKANFFGLRFQVLMALMKENEIQHCDAPLDVFDFVFAAIANVLAVDLAVDTA